LTLSSENFVGFLDNITYFFLDNCFLDETKPALRECGTNTMGMRVASSTKARFLTCAYTQR